MAAVTPPVLSLPTASTLEALQRLRDRPATSVEELRAVVALYASAPHRAGIAQRFACLGMENAEGLSAALAAHPDCNTVCFVVFYLFVVVRSTASSSSNSFAGGALSTGNWIAFWR